MDEKLDTEFEGCSSNTTPDIYTGVHTQTYYTVFFTVCTAHTNGSCCHKFLAAEWTLTYVDK